MSLEKITTQNIGQVNETLAEEHLIQQGLKTLDRNFHSRFGEIDLIMRDQQTLVFVEVKYRKSAAFGGAISAISLQKQTKIRLCANYYLQQHGLNAYNTACRFDVVAIQASSTNTQITWLKNAF